MSLLASMPWNRQNLPSPKQVPSSGDEVEQGLSQWNLPGNREPMLDL
jgi:hypothetical protein